MEFKRAKVFFFLQKLKLNISKKGILSNKECIEILNVVPNVVLGVVPDVVINVLSYIVIDVVLNVVLLWDCML